MGRNMQLTFFVILLVGIHFCKGGRPEVEVKEVRGDKGNEFIFDCIVTYNGKEVTSGVSWTDGEGHELSSNGHLVARLKSGANVFRCKYDVDGWTGHRTLTRVLQTFSSSSSGDRPTAEIKETKGDSDNEYKLDCIVTYMGKEVTSGITWVDANDKELSSNNHLEITLKPGANEVRCKYVVGGWSGHKTLTVVVQTGGSDSEAEQPVAQIMESKGKGTFDLILDCVVVYKGGRVVEGVSWTDGEGKLLSSNNHLEITLKSGPNTMRCNYEIDGWSGHKTLNRILQIDDPSTSNAKPEVEIDEQRGDGKNEYILDCIVRQHGKRVTTGVSWVDGEGKELSDNNLLKVALQIGENVLRCKYKVGGWSGTKTLTMVVQKEIEEAEKPDVTINERQGDAGTRFILDCIVMYKGERVTTGVHWTDGEGATLSENTHLEIVLKTGMNVMRCNYAVGGWTGHKTVVRILQVGGSIDGSDSSSSGSSSGSTGGSNTGGRKVYVIMNTGDPETSYEEWQELCEHRGGQLARIHNAAEQKIVEAVLVKMNAKNVLIDGMRMGGRGDTPTTWVFDDGTEMSYTNWKAGEPNNANRNEPCIQVIGVGSDNLGKWNDVACKAEAALCLKTGDSESTKPETKPAPKPETKPAPKPETKPAPKPETKPAPKPEPKPSEPGEENTVITETKPSKPTGSEGTYGVLPVPTTITKKYVYIQISEKISATEWEERCRKHDGRLASVNNEVEQKLLEEKVLKGLKSNAILTGMKRNPKNLKQFVDPDGKPLSYTNWADKEPNRESETCVELYKENGKWNDIDCKGNAALCEVGQVAAKVVFAPQALPKSYVIVSGIKLTYESWQVKCQAQGGQLAKILNAADQELAEAVVKRVRTHSVIIDGRRTKGKEFQLGDGSKLSYTNWNAGEPNAKGDNEGCIELYSDNGKWNDISCLRGGAALCEVADVSMLAPSLARKTLVLVDSKDELDVAAWKHKCRDYGGILASISNAEDQKTVEGVLRKQKTESKTALIANHRDPKDPKRFLDGDGKAVDFTHWSTGEPNHINIEKCVEVYTNGDKFGRWNDIYCKAKAAICEISKVLPLPVSVKHFGILSAKEKLHVSVWKSKCEAQGGRLATIASPGEAHTAVGALKLAEKRAVLIGVFRSLKDPKKFVTLDDKEVPYTNWDLGEPNSQDERCVEVFSSEGKIGKWNDYKCEGNSAMCEFGYSSVTYAVAPRTKTFWVVKKEKPISLEDWQKECGKKGGHLAHLENPADLVDVKPILKEVDVYSLMVDGKRTNGKFVYSNGTPVNYIRWSKGEPNNDNGKENCLEIFGKDERIGQFNDIPCEHIIALCQN